MSQSSKVGIGRRRNGSLTGQFDNVDVFKALNDADCRTILDATGGDALTASEITDACDIAVSTVYRKLDLLTEANLLEERIRIRESGQHTSEYLRRVEDIDISIDGTDGIELSVTVSDDCSPAELGAVNRAHPAD